MSAWCVDHSAALGALHAAHALGTPHSELRTDSPETTKPATFCRGLRDLDRFPPSAVAEDVRGPSSRWKSPRQKRLNSIAPQAGTCQENATTKARRGARNETRKASVPSCFCVFVAIFVTSYAPRCTSAQIARAAHCADRSIWLLRSPCLPPSHPEARASRATPPRHDWPSRSG